MNITFELAKERTEAMLEKLTECGFDVDEPFEGNIPDTFSIDSGACRVVIIDEAHPDFVIKFGCSESDEKYCKREVEIYEEAKKEGLAKYFAWTQYICEYQGRGIYAMEYLDCDEETVDDRSSDYCWELYCEDNDLDEEEAREDWDIRDEFWDSYNDSTDHTYGVVRYLFSLISAGDAVKLDQLMWHWDINDMHAGNWGLRGKQLVMCDYAGYGW